MPDQIVIVNKAQCKKCGDVLESTHHYDFRMCSCGAVGVDGGHAYVRRMGNPEDYIEMSLYSDGDGGCYGVD